MNPIRLPHAKSFLLASASALAIAVMAPAAHAGPLAEHVMATGATGPAPNPTSAIPNMPSVSTPAQAAAQQAQTSANLAAAAARLQAALTVQANARNAAIAATTTVPDGLATGGLNPDSGLAGNGTANPVLTWVGANTPTQATASNGQATVTVTQTQQSALLNWQSFNVGKNTTLNFVQKDATGADQKNWVALNKVNDPNAKPSQILGAMNAPGSVFVINKNGVIFGGSSQVNVHSLVAAATDLAPSLAANNYQLYLQNGLFSVPNPNVGGTQVSGNAAVFQPGTGKVSVEAGAVLDTASNVGAGEQGGFVALVGAGVTNAGTIKAQNGQIILAADGTNGVGITLPTSGAVGAQTAMSVYASTGNVTNAPGGALISNDGAITLAGKSINQLGAATVTTSVTRTGSIQMGPQTTGFLATVTLGPDSVTSILPDETSGTLPTATATADYFTSVLQPRILINGNFDAQGRGTGAGGALIKAPSAAITVNGTGVGSAAVLEAGSLVDLSGLAGVSVPVTQNQISILVTAAEVADDPLAKNLIGKTVTVDARLSGTRADGVAWVGSPILNAAGYVGLVPKTIDQLLTTGGKFNATAQTFVQMPGSTLDVSGGFVTYQAGRIATTKLMDATGHIVDIGAADPTVAYLGIASQTTMVSPRWGISQTFTSPLLGNGTFVASYNQGFNAGTIGVNAVAPILEGAITDNVIVGLRQVTQASAGDQIPKAGTLNVVFSRPADATTNNPYDVVLESQADAGADPFGLASFNFATATSWTPKLVNNAFPVFSDILNSSSLNAVSITGAHGFSVPAATSLMVKPGGSITLDGVSTIAGKLSAPSGAITLTGYTYANGQQQLPPTAALVIAPTAVLDVHGLWVNDSNLPADQFQGSAFVNGGSVSITTLAASTGPKTGDGAFVDVTQSIVLAPGSVIDLSGGGYVTSAGKLQLGSDGLPIGKGGNLVLDVYGPRGFFGAPGGDAKSADYNVLPHGTNPDGSVNAPNQANLFLGGTIYSQGYDGGGTLSLEAPSFSIDGAALNVTADISSKLAKALPGLPASNFTVSDINAGTLVLPTSFFTGGFSQYTLLSPLSSVVFSTLAGSTTFTNQTSTVTVTKGTQLAPRQVNFLPTGHELGQSNGAMVRSFAPSGTLPDGLRKAVSLTLNTANVLLDQGASIVTDPRGSVVITGTNVDLEGAIQARAGSISVLGNNLTVGANAVLDASGTFLPNPLVTAYNTGSVLDAGTITLAGNSNGAVLVRPGAQINLQGASVSAASNLIQLPSTTISRTPVAQAAWSNGGNLQLAGTNIYFAGTVNAAGGAPGAAGGSLTIGAEPTPAAFTGLIADAALASPGNLVLEPAGIIAANLPAKGMPSQLGAFIGADTLSGSGFDSIALNAANIFFAGSQTITIPGALTLNTTAGTIALLPGATGLLPTGVTNPANFAAPACTGAGCIASIGGTTVNLNAGYVRISGASIQVGPAMPVPKLANGTLNVSAQWIDLQRDIAIANTANVNLTSSGAIRLVPNDYNFINVDGGRLGAANGGVYYGGILAAPGNLTLSAAEIYPVSDTQFLLMSTGTLANASTVTILQNGTPTAPLSAGGSIFVSGKTIVQDGTLWAPLGNIFLGLADGSLLPDPVTHAQNNLIAAIVPTQAITLGTGSLTSVSANGLVIPDGTTVDGLTWYLGSNTGNSSLGTGSAVLAVPPAKSISLLGADITTQAGATLDLSGGGDIYATEFVAGTGGSRNVLTSYQQNLSSGALTNTYADGRQVYALVPASQAKVAAYDPVFAESTYYSGTNRVSGTKDVNAPFPNAIAPGQSVTIGAGAGVPAGTYVLMPGMYATLPGAYRVVQVAANVAPRNGAVTTADGSQYVTGVLGNAITGAHSSQSALFQLQSQDVWSKYSQINITSGTQYYSDQAKAAGLNPPPLPVDGGVLTIGASNTLNLSSTNLFGPGTSPLAKSITGAGGQVQISGANILVLASDLTTPPEDCKTGSAAGCTGATNYLLLDADQISKLGAATVLIGGTAIVSNGVEVLTPTAKNLEVKTDAAHPLTGPELVLATIGAATAKGVQVDAGSVIKAIGDVPTGTDRDIVIGADPTPILDTQGNITGYKAGVSGDGAMLRVSNGSTINITRHYVPGIYTGPGPVPAAANPQGVFSIAGASIDGGKALTLDTSGSGSLASDAILKASNYDIAGSLINVGGGTSGVVLSQPVLANFAGAATVRLRSASAIDFYDAGGLTVGGTANPIGTLILDGAGLYSQGGTTTLNATNIAFTDSQATPSTANGLSAAATGILNANAAQVFDFAAGGVTLANFGAINVNAGQSISFDGAGAFDAKGATVNFTAPLLLANAGSNQSFTTTAALAITASGTAAATDVANIGGGVSLTASAISDAGLIRALGGNVGLIATSGDLVLAGNAAIDASGSRISILDITEDAPAGNIRLISNTGNVKLASGSDVNVGAAGNGYAGALTILAPGTVTLGGTLHGQAAFKDLGGKFTLQAGALDASSTLPVGGFSGGFAVNLGSGDITIGAGQTLASDNVLLVAGSGNIIVNGTIDASNPNGGSIALYGAGGVNVSSGAVLKAAYQTDDPSDPAFGNGTAALMQRGGTITLGTTGTSDGTLNATYGYQNVATSGAINVASGALLDVSGGPGGDGIDSTGGEIDLRAPLLKNNTVNVSYAGTTKGTGTGNGLVLNAYAVWSTDDNGGAASATHFDGIIDPAGWFDATGTGLAGTDQTGAAVAHAPTPSNPMATGKFFKVTTANSNHVDFYQTTLVNFVENFAPTTGVGGANVHLRPEIDLINPDANINGGNITVASNWNLGAGIIDSNGNIKLTYRTNGGAEPGTVALLARNNVKINASVTDGFFTNYVSVATSNIADAAAQYNAETGLALYQTYLTMFAPDGNLVYDQSNILNQLTALGTDWAGAGFPGSAPTVNTGEAGPDYFGLTQAQYNALNLQFKLAMPAVITASDPRVADQYNQYYAQYVAMFHAYLRQTVAFNAVQTDFGAGPQPGGSIATVDFFRQFWGSLGYSFNVDPTTAVIPAAPSLASSYYDLTHGLGAINSPRFPSNGVSTTSATDYVTLWTTYFFNYMNVFTLDVSGFGQTLADAIPNGARPSLDNVPNLLDGTAIYYTLALAPPAPPPAYQALQPDYPTAAVPAHPADLIANNPAVYQPPGQAAFTVLNTTTSGQLMAASPNGTNGFSYDFVGGAAFTPTGAMSVNPLAVVPQASLSSTVTGNVTIDGHSSYNDTDVANRVINLPSVVRTGTGSIDIAAAGDMQFLDKTRPGAIYTAGAAAKTPGDFTAPVPLGAAATNGLIDVPAWATGGGAVSVTTGGSIIGIEMPNPDTDGSQTGLRGNATGQLWSDWYFHGGKPDGSATPFANGNQTAAWVNYATFFQGFGALGGGDMSLVAGKNIVDVGASLPETLVVGGGRTIADPPKATYFGGGNLLVQAGGDLVSSDFLVGRGTGLIQAGGAVRPDPNITVPRSYTGTTTFGNPLALPLLLAVQDAFVSVQAKGALNLGNIYDPASLPSNAEALTPYFKLPGGGSTSASAFGQLFTTFGPNSGVSLVSLSGDVNALTVTDSGNRDGISLFLRMGTNTPLASARTGYLLPATLDIAALSGNILFQNSGPLGFGNSNLLPYPSATGGDKGTANLVAKGDINLGLGLAMPDLKTGLGQVMGTFNVDYTNYISPLGMALPALTTALHAGDTSPVLIAAGGNIFADNGTQLTFIKPVTIEAGNNIVAAVDVAGRPATTLSGAQNNALVFVGQNNNPGDVTSITAGNDIVGGTWSLYGPGTFLVSAGGDLGPLTTVGKGIATLGNGSNTGSSTDFRPYLPAQGADTYVLFGVKPGIDYAAAIADYVNPASAGNGGIDFLADIAAHMELSRDQAWTAFQGLPAQKQQFLVERAFLDFLTQVATDYRNPASPYFAKYGRAYDAIATLFPASKGYTDNAAGGSGNGAANRVVTGNLNIASSILESQMGGDINLLGPGGSITLGHSTTDTLNPSQEGVLTLAGGNIRSYTDGSVILNQSRIMTLQGGDIDIFSANGDILAGSGPKTYVSDPPISVICDVNGFCFVNPQGLVTGAGIGALVTLPGQDPKKSNATLVAPHGTVDAGSAGIRVAGNLNIVALQVLNAFNINVGGQSFGLPPKPTTNLSLTTASTAATEAASLARQVGGQRSVTLSVEVTGFGGGDSDQPSECIATANNACH